MALPSLDNRALQRKAGRLMPAGLKLANPWGLYDMHGNGWEWCGSWFNDWLPGGAIMDWKGPDYGPSRAHRGGEYAFPAAYARSASHSGARPYRALDGGGFRVVLAAE